MSMEVRKSQPTLHRRSPDPIGYDTHDPQYIEQVADDALAGRHSDAIEREVCDVMKRWGMRQ